MPAGAFIYCPGVLRCDAAGRATHQILLVNCPTTSCCTHPGKPDMLGARLGAGIATRIIRSFATRWTDRLVTEQDTSRRLRLAAAVGTPLQMYMHKCYFDTRDQFDFMP